MTESQCQKNCPCEEFINLRDRVEEHEKRLAAGDTAFALLRRDIEILTATCNESNQIVKELKEVPTKRVDSVVDTIIRWVVPLFLGWVISQVNIF